MSDSPSSPLSKDQLALLNLLSPMIEEYLTETNLQVSVMQYLSELAILPIRIDGHLMGFWGVKYHNINSKIVITIKGFYLKKEFRGKYRNRAADDLIRGLMKQGVSELEIWADQKMQAWLEDRYQIKPKIYVTHNPIETFKIFD